MTELKREYVVPLRRKIRTAPKWRRSKKAVSVLKEFIKKHMKTDNVVICRELNEAIWQRGIKNPPGKVSVVALKIQQSQDEKTLVNLLEVGVDKYAQAYRVDTKKSQKDEKLEEKIDSKDDKSKTENLDSKDETSKEKVDEKNEESKTTKVESKEDSSKEDKKVEIKEEKKSTSTKEVTQK